MNEKKVDNKIDSAVMSQNAYLFIVVSDVITMPANGLQLELVRFWNTRLPKRLNKDTMFLGICKMKISFAERP